jgi:hypothetical protein
MHKKWLRKLAYTCQQNPLTAGMPIDAKPALRKFFKKPEGKCSFMIVI